ncbi:PRC-barrel domain-containing protein [Chryseosolibacter indicus]|uniref:PRC-barrel domain-containing protein n=1 Tax=Chryseosolibacter indicus TaxID=2782351 RepID=A0ABS5VM00_9BACT|nr:PRC-barrel domain-containing protein [Chryseosolibacter indicus]MBT1701797.1 PRC-barrel domain-containing protein [Chryseosolibacter indicus]
MATTQHTYEVDNKTGINHEGQQPNIPVRRLTATSIIGDRVENYSGEDLGTINNLMVNVQTGGIEYAVIEFGSFIGIGGKLFAIPFQELQVDPKRQIFLLNRDKDYLKQSPGFDKDHWPDTNDHQRSDYFNDVNTYYNKTPVFPVH